MAQERPPPTRRVGGQFLAGAGGRLLPASVPLRWFAAAAVFHALAWLALAAGASQWPGWRGGPGWPLAALHLVTVGTLVSSAIGASLQLLPVATRQPVRGPRLAALLWWLYVPGAALLALGMGLAQPAWMVAGAALVLPVLGIWGLLLALNLRGARGMPGVVLHGWGAAASLLVLMGSAAALVALWNGTPLLPRDDARALHAAAGVIGVMGLLVLGLSSILLPLFALAPVPDEGAQLRSGATVCVALLLMALAAFAPAGSDAAQVLRWTALLAAAWALATHVRAMRRSWAEGLRSDLGRSGRLFRIGWGGAALAISFTAIGLVRGHDGADLPWGPLAVLAALGGWLLSILFGVLQRILPFLASLHAARRAGRRPPTPSALTAEGPLRVH
ncbi:MAG: hypothetical protein OEV65_14790, partial [Aquincola sp.]|nr:hypothetical protein [Aquincola sp.]